MLLDKLTITGNLPYDLGFGTLRTARYNIDFCKLERELDLIRSEIFTSQSNAEAHSYIARVFRSYDIECLYEPVNRPGVKLNAWVTGEVNSSDSIELCLCFNMDKRITAGNWFYFKGQILSILMHEIVHYYRAMKYGREETDFGYISSDNDYASYLGQNEELHAYSYQILFDLILNANRSSLLTLYNKRITDQKTLKNLTKILNSAAKAPIFCNKNYKFELI